jgi:hypothetical protein
MAGAAESPTIHRLVKGHLWNRQVQTRAWQGLCLLWHLGLAFPLIHHDLLQKKPERLGRPDGFVTGVLPD